MRVLIAALLLGSAGAAQAAEYQPPPEAQARMLIELGRAYQELGELQMAVINGRKVKAEPPPAPPAATAPTEPPK